MILPGFAEEEDDGRRICLPVREFPVLLPSEGQRGYAVHHDREGHEGQVDDLHPPGGVVGKVLPSVETPEEKTKIEG